MSTPFLLATCQIVSPGSATTSLPSRVNLIGLLLIGLFALPSFLDQWSAWRISHQLPNGFVSSSGKYFSTHSNGFGAAWPSPQMDASRIVVESSSSSFTSHGPLDINLAAFSVPARHGVHWPQLSSSKNFMRFNAAALMSSLSDRITTACDPTKQPYFSSIPKSSGISAIEAGRMPPEAPPGRYPLNVSPSAMPPQYSSISSFTVMPAGASFTPGSFTRPETEKLRKPLRSWRPCEVTHAAPFSTMSRIQNSVSTFCSKVGRPNRPTWATNGGRWRGSPRLP